jgi:hypothetical protein
VVVLDRGKVVYQAQRAGIDVTSFAETYSSVTKL